ncbi:hypothetical protein Poly51_62160 [Rubripirellula tenax]|uniref:Uncharacterized protein n=1 Tax=Rubripirellula tenax TaxID=2528015 RepID=A0A5C6E599_9BACT|nr:hypothetical protein Poly51_62160 [Rubripirellula tenax]
MFIRFCFSALLLSQLLSPTLALAERLISVPDGRTIVTDRRTVRIAGIRVPSMRNSPGRDSQAHLRRLLKRGSIRISGNNVFVNGKDIAEQMVRSRMADAIPGSKYVQAENESKIGPIDYSRYSTNQSSIRRQYVPGYWRNGTYVKAHYRSVPDSTKSNNWSTQGNVNPVTGKKGYQ